MKSSNRSLSSFFLITFAWSWALNLPRVLGSIGLVALPAALSPVLGNLAIFGPSVAAFILTGRRDGRKGVRALWKRGWERGFDKNWLIPTLLLFPVAAALTVLVLWILDQPIAWEYSLPVTMIIPVGLLIWLLAYAEEYGWRGYALDRLQEKLSPLAASLLLGLLWGMWHLPLHFIQGTTQAAIPVVEYVLQNIVTAALYTWLHNGTGGSVLVASLFHTMGNLTGALIPSWTSSAGRWANFGIFLIAAVIVALRGPSALAQGPARASVNRHC